jgi:transcription elongation factor SPT6
LRPLTLFTVKIVCVNVAALYESSAFAESDLREFSRLVRRAVGLGRSCIDPLAVLAALLNTEGNELLSLRLHPLQAALPKAKRRASLEALLVTAVSQVGVSINECAQKEWLAPLLQFVPGLGPRKAVHLLRVRSILSPSYDEHSGDTCNVSIVTCVLWVAA